MKKLLGSMRFVLAIALATVIGSVTTVAVMAAIPNSNGSVSTCYNKVTGVLKVIDTGSGQTCTRLENSLRLGTGNANSAFVYLNPDGSLNTTLSKNISNYKLSTANGTISACINVGFNPLDGYGQNNGVDSDDVIISNITTSVNISSYCGSGFNAIATNIGPNPDYSGYIFTFLD